MNNCPTCKWLGDAETGRYASHPSVRSCDWPVDERMPKVVIIEDFQSIILLDNGDCSDQRECPAWEPRE